MNLEKMVQKISNKDELAKFVCELRKDLCNNPSTWENKNLEDYLEAMQSWLEDMDGWEKNCNIDISKMNPWQLFGYILIASSIYE